MKTCYFYLKMKHALKDKFRFTLHAFKNILNPPKDDIKGAGCEPAESLRHLRLLRGFTVENISAAVGVCPAVIEQWETGDLTPSSEDAIKLSTVYGCSLKEVYKALLHTPET